MTKVLRGLPNFTAIFSECPWKREEKNLTISLETLHVSYVWCCNKVTVNFSSFFFFFFYSRERREKGAWEMISVIENPTLSSSNSEASDFHDAKRERIMTRLGKFRRKRTKIPARNSSRLYICNFWPKI